MNNEEKNDIFRKICNANTPEIFKRLIKTRYSTQKEFRKEFVKWLHQQQLSGKYTDQNDICDTTITRYVTGQQQMRFERLKMFADFFNVDPEYLEGVQAEERLSDHGKEYYEIKKKLELLAKDYAKFKSFCEILAEHDIYLWPKESKTESFTFPHIDNGMLYEGKMTYPTDALTYGVECSEFGELELSRDQYLRFKNELFRYAKYYLKGIKDNSSHPKTDIIETKQEGSEHNFQVETSTGKNWQLVTTVKKKPSTTVSKQTESKSKKGRKGQ